MCVCLIQKTVSGNFGLVWFGFFPVFTGFRFYKFQVVHCFMPYIFRKIQMAS